MKLTLGILFFYINIISTVNSAALSNSGNSQFYYEIGGARSITSPVYVNPTSTTVSGSAEFGLGYSCGKFDPTLGISNIFKELSSSGSTIINGAIGAVSAAIGSLPALILQRVNPGLYDLYQNALIRAEAQIALANKTCEQYESDIRQGKNPYSEWADISKIIDWKVEMKKASAGSNTDVYRAKKSVERTNGDKGIPWIGNLRKGGKHQKNIQVTKDIVKAGYNMSLNQAPNASGVPSSSSSGGGSRLTEVWGSSLIASQWAVDVLGDIHIRTHDNHPITTVPGHGLLPKIEGELMTIQSGIASIVDGSVTPSTSTLDSVSSDSIMLNYDLIKAIRHLEPSEQVIAISKLSSEIAMSKTLEKALFLRRMLLTGLREPNVVNVAQAMEYGKELVAVIDQEIDNILFEKRVRKALASTTASVILSMQNNEEKQGKSKMKTPDFDENSVTEGATQ